MLDDDETIVPVKQIQSPGFAKMLIPLNRLCKTLNPEEKKYLLDFTQAFAEFLEEVITQN